MTVKPDSSNIKRSSKKVKRVAVIGTQGVPAKYGGFESLVENLIGENCPDNVEYTVFCSSKDMPDKLSEYKGCRLKYLPLKANGAQSVIYDAACLSRCLWGYDTILILGVSGCWCLPVLKRIFKGKIIINIDGLEHRRDKWKPWVKKFLRYSEEKAVKYADTIVADNKGIQDYVSQTYSLPSQLIAYGGDQAQRKIDDKRIKEILRQYGVSSGKYAMTVCRIEPENNSRMVLEAFSGIDYPLLYVGNWNHSDYSKNLREDFSKFENLHLVDGIYDLDILYALRSNAGAYVHGHSAGGTNPSLVEAMYLGADIVAFDVIYNRETTENQALYFKNKSELRDIMSVTPPHNGQRMAEIAQRRYRWDIVAKQYLELY